MFLLPLCGLFIYGLIENELLLKYNKKLTYNYISCIHIFFVILTFLIKQNYNNNLLYSFSILNTTGYFINDILFIIKNRKFKMKDLIYLYHHFFSAIYVIYQPENSYTFLWLFSAELSNIPGHIVYHYIKTDNKTNFQINIKNNCEKIQVFIYGFIRVFYLSYITYLEYNVEKNDFQRNIFNLTFPLFIMGWAYSYVLIKKIYCSSNNEKKLE
jgi:hypothetical protein